MAMERENPSCVLHPAGHLDAPEDDVNSRARSDHADGPGSRHPREAATGSIGSLSAVLHLEIQGLVWSLIALRNGRRSDTADP
jgi:hypothetical protein